MSPGGQTSKERGPDSEEREKGGYLKNKYSTLLELKDIKF